MALLLREAQVAALVSMPEVIEAVESATRDLGRGEAQNQPRRRVFPPGGVLNVMFASWPAGGVSGLKSYTVAQGRARFLITLYGLDGRLLALIEADHLGALRTGAASGVAARALCPGRQLALGVIGTGKQALTQVEALRQTLELREVRVFGRDPGRRTDFARASGATAAASAREAVEGCDVVVTMTNSKDPVLEADWVMPDALVIGAGSNYPHRRELPTELVRTARAVVVDQRPVAELESGDLLLADYDVDSAIELGEVLAGVSTVPAGEGRILFESHGLALWDLAAAKLVLDRALALGVGESVDLGG